MKTESNNNTKLMITMSVLAVFAAIISAFSALYSGYLVNEANKFNQEINKAAISFVKTNKNFDRKDDKLVIDFSFVFKNTGNEALFIDNKQTFILNLKTGQKTVSKKKQILNTIHPDVEFIQQASQNFTIIKPDLSTEEIVQSIKTDLYLIIRLDYSNDRMSDYEIFYTHYKGGYDISHLSLSQYKTIETYLPPEFQLDRNKKNFEQTKNTN